LVSFVLRPPASTLFPYTTLFRSRATNLFTNTFSPKGSRASHGPNPHLSPPEPSARGHRCGADGGHHRTRRTGDAELSARRGGQRSEEHTSELQSRENLVCRLLLE